MSALRTLQRGLNATVEELCALVAGAEDGDESLKVDLEPGLFVLPLPDPVLLQPRTKTPLGYGASFYVGAHSGLLQLAQRPVVGAPTSRYALTINFAAFDGRWLSIVFDLRRLLESACAGRAHLVVQVDQESLPSQALQLKCTWQASGGEIQSRQLAVEDRCPDALVLDLGWLGDPLPDAMDLHLVFSASGRGSIVLRGVRAALLVRPGSASTDGLGPFEDQA